MDKSEELENARAGYQVAVALWSHLGRLVWSEYNAMLVVNGIVVAAVGITVEGKLPFPTVGLSIVGLVLCALWFQLLRRGTQHYQPYVAAARELEDKYLGDHVTVISRGNRFAQHEEVTYEIDGKPITLRMPWLGGLASTKVTDSLVIALFAVVYSVMLIQALLS
jgi:hypothetical protein